MSTTDNHGLERWADGGHFRPRAGVVGPQASADGRALLEAAGVDLEALERRVGGRPRVGGGAGAKGVRSPRVNAAVDPGTDREIERVRRDQGITRSDLVRAALADYLSRAS